MKKKLKSLDNIISNQQIKTVFQPIVSLKSGNVLGYEALSRATSENEFDNPEHMFLTAHKLERLWELEALCRIKALEAARAFLKPPYNKKLFMNVSPNIMNDEDFQKGFTAEFLKDYDISPDNIIFEITERDEITDRKNLQRAIHHYKNQNYMIALDDTGAGYSGLSLISELNPNYIKMDMEMIRDIDKNRIKRALIKGLVEFSKISNVALIAEGIETKEELVTVINLGVHYGQGYYLQRPDAEIHEIKEETIQLIQASNTKINQKHQQDIYHVPIKDLATPTMIIPPHTPTNLVYDLISKDPHSIGLSIVEDDIPLGIITKEKLASKLSGRYGFTLNQNKEISELMDEDMLSVEGHLPVSVVSKIAMERSNDKLYDFIVVTEKNKYFGTVTIKTILEKAMELEISSARQQSPLTGLPGNLIIEQQLNKCIEMNQPYSVAYLDIDNFKVYNDVYGFESGDLIIKLLADILRELIPNHQFIGHIGGDDFVVIYNEHASNKPFDAIMQKFETEALHFYHPEDIEKGYVTAKNRQGVLENFPLITMTAVMINNKDYNYQTAREMSKALVQLKTKTRQHKNK